MRTYVSVKNMRYLRKGRVGCACGAMSARKRPCVDASRAGCAYVPLERATSSEKSTREGEKTLHVLTLYIWFFPVVPVFQAACILCWWTQAGGRERGPYRFHTVPLLIALHMLWGNLKHDELLLCASRRPRGVGGRGMVYTARKMSGVSCWRVASCRHACCCTRFFCVLSLPTL